MATPAVVRLELQRDAPEVGIGTFGRLRQSWPTSRPLCHTLEPERPIPASTYRVGLTPSVRVAEGQLWSPDVAHGRLPEVLQVPGRTGIRIHAGNTVSDTAGCLLVGLTRNGYGVRQSRLALEALMDLIGDGLVMLDVRDPVPLSTTA